MKNKKNGNASNTSTYPVPSSEKITIKALEDSPVFEDYITQTACSDPSVQPCQTIHFLKSGRSAYLRLVEDNGYYLRRIRDRIGDLSTATEGRKLPKITVQGSSNKFAVFLNDVITFCHLVAQHRYKKNEHLDMVLKCVSGEIKPEQLPPAKPTSYAADNNTGNGKTAKEKKLKFTPAAMTVNELTPRTENQERYVKLLDDNRYEAVMAQGPAGTGKTRLLLQTLLRRIRDHYRGVPSEKYGKLILSMPLVYDGRDLGAMPGTLAQKTNMWFETYYKHLARILAPQTPRGDYDLRAGTADLYELISQGIIEIAPLETLYGKSFEGAFVVLDEAQRTHPEQMITFMTRIEENSRMFIIGDLEQQGLHKDNNNHNRQKGQAFLLPNIVSIDQDGVVEIKKFGRTVSVGFHKDIGHFVMGSKPGVVEKVYPLNGFAQALMLYSGSPRIACTSLNFSDIQRSGVGRDLLMLHRGLRIVGDEITGTSPNGVGHMDPKAILADRAQQPEPEQPGKGRFRVALKLAEKRP